MEKNFPFIMISVGKKCLILFNIMTSVAVPIRKSSVLKGEKRKKKSCNSFGGIQRLQESLFQRTIKPIHAHSFAVVIAETTKLRGQDFHGYIADS